MTLVVLGAVIALAVTLPVMGLLLRRQRAELDAIRSTLAPDDLGPMSPAFDSVATLIQRAGTDGGREPADGEFGIVAIGPADTTKITEGLGHAATVEVMEEVGRRLERFSRSGECLAQAADGHFLLLLSAPVSAYGAVRAATRLTESLTTSIRVGDVAVDVRAHAGIALGTDPNAVLEQAEFALSRARQTGADAPQLYDPEERRRVEATFRRAQCLKTAVAHDELHVAYQPLLSLETGEMTAVEALLRWQSPVLGAVSPADFIPIAEDTGSIIELGGWVMERACRDIHEIAGGDADMKVSVNVSVHQLRSPGFLDVVRTALIASELDPHRLQVEVTESVFATPEEITPTLCELRELGVQIALDDVGTGYSSLGQLATLPIDVVKLDRMLLVQREEAGDRADRIFTSIAALGRSLGLEVVAEGVETDEQSQVARRAGCTHEQGFLRGKPVSAEEAAAFARALRTGQRTI